MPVLERLFLTNKLISESGEAKNRTAFIYIILDLRVQYTVEKAKVFLVVIA